MTEETLQKAIELKNEINSLSGEFSIRRHPNYELLANSMFEIKINNENDGEWVYFKISDYPELKSYLSSFLLGIKKDNEERILMLKAQLDAL